VKKKLEPFIGITCDIHVPRSRRWRGYYELVVDHRYPEVVKEAGGYPILLPVAFRNDVIKRYLREIDGIVIVGGDDVDPRLYGERRHRGTGTVFGPRLQFERRLYAQARRRGLPILGICYGMQLINVLEGGTLHQDIRRDAGSRINHRSRREPLHMLTIERRSRLGRILGLRRVLVHSDHHQAVRHIAPRFRAVAFAPDGVIEAIESASKRIFAVQWHPERMPKARATRRLLRAFVRVCRAGSAPAPRRRRRTTRK